MNSCFTSKASLEVSKWIFKRLLSDFMMSPCQKGEFFLYITQISLIAVFCVCLFTPNSQKKYVCCKQVCNSSCLCLCTVQPQTELSTHHTLSFQCCFNLWNWRKLQNSVQKFLLLFFFSIYLFSLNVNLKNTGHINTLQAASKDTSTF